MATRNRTVGPSPAAGTDGREDPANTVLLIANAVDVLSEVMGVSADRAVDLLHAEAARSGRSVEAQAAVIVDRAVRSAEG
ncbi:MAG TPA: hypothetical protein VE081_10905 [Sporichthyaceae bacterium]|nr:hypothetical protein [Sporichthyaceae bacterium]